MRARSRREGRIPDSYGNVGHGLGTVGRRRGCYRQAASAEQGGASTFTPDLMIRGWTRNVSTVGCKRIVLRRKRVLPCCSLQTAVLDELRRLGVRPKRSLGQNFLISESVLSDILDVACIEAGDHVVEIGMPPAPRMLSNAAPFRAPA